MKDKNHIQQVTTKAKKEDSEKVNSTKIYKLGDKVFLKKYWTRKSYWKDGIVNKRIGTVIYIIKGKQFDHKRHVNQIRWWYIESIEQNNVVLSMEMLYDAFEITPRINQKALVDVHHQLIIPHKFHEHHYR